MSTPLQPSDEQAKVITGCLLLLSIIALAGVFYVTQAVLVPFVIAIFIATIVTPLVDLLVLKWKMPQIIAISLTLLLVLTFGFLICMTLIYSTQQVIYKAENQYSEKFGIFINSVFEAAKEADDLPVRKLEEDTKEPQPETPDQKEATPEAPPKVTVDDGEAVAAEKPEIGWFQKMGIDLDTLKKATMDYMRNSLKSIAVSTMQSALNFTTTSFFVAIFVIFLLAGRDPNAVVKNEIYFEIEQKIRSYISTLLPIPVAFAQFSDSPWTIAGVILIPGGIQMAIGNGIEPKLMGEGLQLHPVTVLLALSFWTLLWGPIGAILAVPITAAIRIVLMRFESGRTAGNLLAGILPGGSTTVA